MLDKGLMSADNLDRQTDRQTDIKIAYICLCHTDPQFIGRVARRLRFKQDAFFVHVDDKSDIQPFFQMCSELDHVHFVKDRVKNYWGGFNSIVATMRTIELAMVTDKFDRFVLLQGQDYPLYSPTRIHYFFAKHKNVEFCKGKDISASKHKGDYMRCCGYWLCDYDKHIIPLKIAAGLLHRFNSLGIKYRPSTFMSNDIRWHIYKGWAQWALTYDCVEYIISFFNNSDAFNHFIKHRFPPDELYFHTLIYNSKFKDRVSDNIVYNRSGSATLLNLTYFEYPIQVTIFKSSSDYDWLKQTGCLFVRKVNSSSRELLDRIDNEIGQDSEEAVLSHSDS